MKLSDVLKKITYTGSFEDSEVTFVTDDSRKVAEGCIFVCIEGARFDGHSMASSALNKGAAAVVVMKDLGLPNQILVSDTRRAYALLCSAFFGNPQDKLKIIGVTGTNGKTTTCFILKDILEKSGHRSGLIGTVKNMAGALEFPASLTTPDPYELFELFSLMVKEGCEYCVMEVSSQALDQKRVEGIHFDKAVFTNLTGDHLDYHGSFENYRDAKKKLFEHCDTAILNIDDEYASYMTEGLSCKTVTFSVKSNQCDYSAKDVIVKSSGVKYELVSDSLIGRVKFPVTGMFSVSNSLGAAVCALECGISLDDVITALGECSGVPGRMETVATGRDFTVIIDYAHTPDGLEKLLSSLDEVKGEGRLLAVFGCGGDRDKTKRPVMGKIAVTGCDRAFITSDNPRSEDPEKIISDILKGVPEKCRASYTVICDRTKAIHACLDEAKENDIVVLAGKGHETYQILADGRIDFDERKVVLDYLNS